MDVSRAGSLLRVSDPEFLRFGRRGAVAFIVLGCLLIAGWQWVAIDEPKELDRTYERRTGVGFFGARAQKYFYFLYYTGKFPITTGRSVKHLIWNEERAWEAIQSGPPDRVMDAERARAQGAGRRRIGLGRPRLLMEQYTYLRTGDLGRIFLLYPHAWIHGTPKRATLRAFNAILGVASLIALFVSFSLLNHRLLGTALVAVIGSNPYQLVELYGENNLFGYPIAVASLMLALHAPLILGRWPGRATWLLPLASGLFLACVREVRAEPALVILSLGAVYLLTRRGWRPRLVLLGTLVLAFTLTSRAWSGYWEYKFDEAHEIVETQGGRTFDGEWNRHHAIWHSIWCGLGDFGREKGYLYSDKAAYRYGIPEVNRRFGRNYTRTKNAHLLTNRDASGKHRIKPENLEEYSIVLREKILSDIRQDPLWYLNVLRRRIVHVFTDITPVRLGIGSHWLDIPFAVWLFIPALAGLVALRLWDQVQLLAFYLPTSLTAVAVFAHGGVTYHSAFHLALFALVVCWTVNGAIGLYSARVRLSRAPDTSG